MMQELLRAGICLVAASLTLYAMIEQNNALTALQLAIPEKEKEVKNLQQENERLRYQIEAFENPASLIEMLKQPEFQHLKYPKQDEVWILEVHG